MLVGTCFYATVNNLGWAKGFYMAVNVGYSIGWGYPNEIDDITRLFSTAYILVGASVVAASLAYFASSVITASKEWYATALQERKLHSSDLHRRLHAWVLLNQSALQFLLVWLLIIGALVAFSVAEIKWDFSQAVYFAVASLSTGGLWAIPKESPDWYYGVGKSVPYRSSMLCVARMHVHSFLYISPISQPDDKNLTLLRGCCSGHFDGHRCTSNGADHGANRASGDIFGKHGEGPAPNCREGDTEGAGNDAQAGLGGGKRGSN